MNSARARSFTADSRERRGRASTQRRSTAENRPAIIASVSYDPATNIFVTDAPLAEDDPRPDLLEREWFAEQVAQRIAQAGTGDSVVFGLAGPWGAGKTSTLTQIKKALEDVPNEWKVVEFTPWAANNELALTCHFHGNS